MKSYNSAVAVRLRAGERCVEKVKINGITIHQYKCMV